MSRNIFGDEREMKNCLLDTTSEGPDRLFVTIVSEERQNILHDIDIQMRSKFLFQP